MAQLCRSTWGDMRFLVREGHRSAALATCLARIYSKPDRVREKPAALRKSSGAGAFLHGSPKEYMIMLTCDHPAPSPRY